MSYPTTREQLEKLNTKRLLGVLKRARARVLSAENWVRDGLNEHFGYLGHDVPEVESQKALKDLQEAYDQVTLIKDILKGREHVAR